MKIGMIGSGNVAQTLAKGYLAKGHEVKLGTRDTTKFKDWIEKAGEKASVGSFAEAAKFGEIVFLSVPETATNGAIELAGKENLAGKILIDLRNPMDFSQGIPPRFTVTFGNSLGEQVQRALPETLVVKAFNSIGVEVMTDAQFGTDTATMFIAGNDAGAKSKVAALIGEFGWNVDDLGDIGQALYLEAFASLWVNYGLKSGSREHAFKLLKR